LREEGEVLFLPRHGFWIALGYGAVHAAFSQPALFSNEPYEPIDAALLANSPPHHGAIRKVVSREFGSEKLRSAALAAQSYSRSLLKPQFDVVSDYGLPISRHVTSLMIGFDAGVTEQVIEMEDALSRDPAPIPKLTAALDALAHRSAMYRRIRSDEPQLVSEEQCRSLVRLMWIAGTMTTERVITRCVLECLLNRGLGERLREQPELRAPFVEEVLRLYPPEHMVPRLTTADVALGGTLIPRGSVVNLCTAAANRDPSRYPKPNELDCNRSERGHFSFGSGIHACVGAPLSRRVIGAALSTLLEPGVRVEPTGPLSQLDWLHTVTTLAPRRLEVTLASA
jgi:cytochrome P450